MSDERFEADEPFVGVEPIDCEIGRRPGGSRRSTRRGKRPAARASNGGRPVARAGVLRSRSQVLNEDIGATLFPAGEPALVDEMKVNGERMSTAWVVSVLMDNRDLTRRLAAESGVELMA